MYFVHLKQREIEQDERYCACIYDLKFGMKREQQIFLSLELKLSLVLDPIKTLVFGEINSKWDPQVSISFVDYFSIPT